MAGQGSVTARDVAQGERYATPEEVARQIDKVSHDKPEMRRLEKFAGAHTWGSDYAGRPGDLLSDAMYTAYVAAVDRQQAQKDGHRRGRKKGRAWRVHVPFLAYLYMTISGIASDARGLAFFRRRIWAMIEELDLPAPEVDEEDAERQQRRQELLERTRQDPELAALLDLLDAHKRPLEIQQHLQLSETDYASLRRRLRRAIQRQGTLLKQQHQGGIGQ